MNKYFTAFVLCMAFLAGLLPGFGVYAGGLDAQPEIQVTCEGRQVEEILLKRDEKICKQV